MRNLRISTMFSGVFVRLLRVDYGSSPCLPRASFGAVRLTPVGFLITRVALLPWGPVRLLSVLVYLVLFSRFLQFEEQDAIIPLEAFYSGLGYTLTRYLHCRYLKQIVMGSALTK